MIKLDKNFMIVVKLRLTLGSYTIETPEKEYTIREYHQDLKINFIK